MTKRLSKEKMYGLMLVAASAGIGVSGYMLLGLIFGWFE